MGKWDALKGKFPGKPVSSDQSFVEKVDQRRVELSTLSLKELIAYYQEVDACHDALEAGIKACNVDYEALNRLILERFEADGVSSVKTETGKTLYQQFEPSTSVYDREKLFAYLEARPELDYLWNVQWQSLNALVKEKLENGEEVPPEMGVEVFIKSSVRMRKA